jgi:hypothetical protein
MQITFTLQSQYTGATYVAGPFDISGTTSNNDTYLLDSNVLKADLITGHVVNTIYETITGGTICSAGTCTNCVDWSIAPTPTATPESYSLSVYLNDVGSPRDPSATLFYSVNGGSQINVPGATGTEFPATCTLVYTITGLSNGDSVEFGTSMLAIMTGNDDSTSCPPWSGSQTTYTTTVNSVSDTVALTVDTFNLP